MQRWKNHAIAATGVLLCLAALTFPFSVAITNIALTLALLASLISTQLQQGVLHLWNHYRPLILSILAYLVLVITGLVWSLNQANGLEVVGHLWLWLILPLSVSVLSQKEWQKYFLLSLSCGLTLHLVFCVLQRFGIVPPPESAGSSLIDATGYIGHISFGIVYGIWGGWLLHFGWQRHNLQRSIPWMLSAWSFSMIFLAEGRSGYLVAATILLVVAWKHLIAGHGTKRITSVIVLFTVMGIIILIGPGKERVANTIKGVSATLQGDYNNAEQRSLIWIETIEVWKQHPIMGTGTGGYVKGVEMLRSNSPEHPLFKNIYSHAHNIYLQSLVRWGPLGVTFIVLLFYFWVRQGFRTSWDDNHAQSLVLLSGTALIVHGLSSVSLEEHFATLMAIFSLGAGLASTPQPLVKNSSSAPVHTSETN